MIKHDRNSLEKNAFTGLWFHGITVCCGGEALQQEQKVASMHLEPPAQSRESALGMARGFESSKPAPGVYFFNKATPPQTAPPARDQVQTQESVGTLSLKITGASLLQKGPLCVSWENEIVVSRISSEEYFC